MYDPAVDLREIASVHLVGITTTPNWRNFFMRSPVGTPPPIIIEGTFPEFGVVIRHAGTAPVPLPINDARIKAAAVK